MSEKKSQREVVKEKLMNEGVINNLWCLQNGIWRLSDLILHLRRDENMNITTEFNTERVGKNTHYHLVPKNTLF